MKSISAHPCYFIYVFLFNIVLGDRVGISEKRHVEEIYMTSSTLDWSVLTPNPRILSTVELFLFESNCANFFEVKIKSSAKFSKDKIIDVNFDVIDQSIATDAMQYNIVAYLSVTYSGEFPDNYSDKLSTLVTREKMNELIVIQHEFLDSTSQSVYSAFSKIDTPSLLGSTNDGEKNNILLFIALIGISSILAITSATLLYQSGYCFCSQNERVESTYDIKQTLTEETGDEESWNIENSTVGKLGATKQPDSADNIIVAITPNRGIDHGYEAETPFSQQTFQTGVSKDSTVTSRDPLGIVSMNTLNKLLHTPQTKKSSKFKALYNVALSNE